MTKTIPELIQCAERELRLRVNVYGRRVLERKMASGSAEHEITCMREIIELLKSHPANRQMNLRLSANDPGAAADQPETESHQAL